MKHILLNVFEWIKNPDEKEMNVSFKERLALVGKIFLWEVLFAIPILGLINIIEHYVFILEDSIDLNNYNRFSIFILMVLLMPIFEEFIFRFPLKYKRNYLARLIDWLTSGWLKQKWDSIFKYFLYTSIIVFGLIHAVNYLNNDILFYAFLPIIVGSQLIGGFFMSYIRIKIGFRWSLIQHIAWNFACFILITL